MSLTTDEKKLLKSAICDGQFNGLAVSENGMAMRGNITPDVLNYVAGLADEDIRVQLRQYQANKVAQATAQLTREQAQATATQTGLAALQAIQITSA